MKKIVFGIFIGLIISGGVVYAATALNSKDVLYTPNNDNFNVDNVESALNELYDKISSIPTELNWTMVISYSVCLGWNGNYSYGCDAGTMTIKNVDGTKTITNSGGAKSSPRASWNGSYYINATISSISITSFTIDE